MTDFSECEFIEETMKIYTYKEFCKSRFTIKRLFNVLTKNGKRFYMWYIYANTHMSLKQKNAIWDYLNDYDLNGFNLLQLSHIEDNSE